VIDIVLVQPPNPMLSDPTTRWPLGLGYLEAVLTKAGYEVAVVDLRDKELDVSLIPEAPTVGITATTGEFGMAKELAHLVKERSYNTFTVIGGAHATYLPEDCDGYFDTVVIGESENLPWDRMLSQKPPSCGVKSPVKDLDNLPFPTRHPFSFSETLFEGAGYGKGPKATSIITSRGCPFSCAFCQEKPRLARFRSPENVAEEIREIIEKWDCHHFRFEDDSFTLKPERVFEICRLLEPLKVHWRCHTRSDLFDREMARAVRLAGCDEVGFGVESADQRVLNIINKKESLEQHIKAIRIAEDSGIKAKAFFMTGLPGETDGIVELTKEFLQKAQPSKIILSRFTPYPGSDVWAHPDKYGVAWIDPEFEHYWNFPHTTTITYHDATADVLDQRYKELHTLLWSGEWTSQEAKRQKEQLQRYLNWIEREGATEGPTRIDTMVQPQQVSRMQWLKEHCVGTIIEVGCNFGIVLAWCGGQAGVDSNSANVRLAKILAPRREFTRGDVCSLPYPNGYFDTVMLPDILEHLFWSDVPTALEEARRVARRKILITFPDGESDSPMALAFKHAWLATPEKVLAIKGIFSAAAVTIKRKEGFILMEVIK